MTDQNNNQPVSNEATAMMAYQNGNKSIGVAYLLWFFLGGLGIHRFYLGKTVSAVIILLCTLIGVFTLFPLFITAIFLIVDLFLIPSMVNTHNTNLMVRIKSGVPG